MAVIVPAQTHLNSVELDMRGDPHFGRDLAEDIEVSCAKTQSPIMLTHPDMLILLPEQFKSCLDDMQKTEGYTERIWYTKAGFVMDVRVIDENGTWIKELEPLLTEGKL